MKVGDILLEIDGRVINKIQDFYAAVEGRNGQKVNFMVNRKGENIILRVQLWLII